MIMAAGITPLNFTLCASDLFPDPGAPLEAFGHQNALSIHIDESTGQATRKIWQLRERNRPNSIGTQEAIPAQT